MSQSLRLNWHSVVKGVSVGVAFCMTVYTIFIAGPLVESKFFPVLEKLEITSVMPTGEETSNVYVEFTKLRECAYVGVAWFEGRRSGGFHRVLFVAQRNKEDSSSPNRPLGKQTAGPWLVGIKAEDVKTNSFVDIFHQCHPFWVTKTQWYP